MVHVQILSVYLVLFQSLTIENKVHEISLSIASEHEKQQISRVRDETGSNETI